MEIINFLRSFAEQNGSVDVIVLILTVIFTNLIKVPIKKNAEKTSALAQKAGFNLTKTFFTNSIVYIPYAVAFTLFCIAGGIQHFIGSVEFSFVIIMAKTAVIATTSIGFYNLIANTIEKKAEKEIYSNYKQQQIIEEAEKKEKLEQQQLENKNNEQK